MMRMRHIAALLPAASLLMLLAGCAGSRSWTVPADLSHGEPSRLVADAAGAGKLSALMEAAETQLFDSDEDRMADFLRAALASGKLMPSETETAEWMLHDVCERNAPGTTAADFRFATPDISENTLLTYLPGKPLCVIFYDPDCDHCKKVIAKLSGELASLVDVLAVCVDSTPRRWEQTRDALPGPWVKAFDRSEVTLNDIYMIRSLPSIYLLDADRTVVMKNPTAGRLLDHLKGAGK